MDLAKPKPQSLLQRFTTPFDEMTKYDEAAWLLDLAMRGKYVVASDKGSSGLPRKAEAINVYSQYLLFLKIYKYAVLISLAITVFETPLWCDGEGHLWVPASPQVVCHVPGEEVLLSGMPLIPTGYGIIIEILCFAAIGWKLHLEWKLEKYFSEVGIVYRSLRRRQEGIALVAIGCADLLYFCVALDTNYRAAPYVRFLLGASIPSIRKVLRSFARTIVAIKEVSLFLAGTVVLFAWVGSLLFYHSKDEDVAKDFRPMTTSLYSCFLAVTTVNLPDVMVPTLAQSGGVYLAFWWPLLIFGAVVFMNVILAVVYNDYSDGMEERQKSFFEANQKGMDDAFNLAADNVTTKTGEVVQGLSFEGFTQFQESLQKLHISVDMTLVQFVFAGLDDDQSGYLGRTEFYDMCDVLQYRFRLTTRDSPLLKAIPALRTLKSLCDNGVRAKTDDGQQAELGYTETFPGSTFDRIMNVVLGINVVFIVVESVFDVRNIPEPAVFDQMDLVFTYVYLLEVCVKLSVWSWGEYWSSFENKFDFITSLLLAGMGTVVQSGIMNFSLPSGEILMFLNLLRLVRVVKAIGRLDSLKREFRTMSKMVQASFDVLLINILVLYIWSAWGLQLFGGELYTQNGRYIKMKPDDLDYYDQKLQVFNFNDVLSGFCTLFFFALTGWVPEIGEAMILLSGDVGEGNQAVNIPFKLFTWFFLLTFYLASPLIAFNIFTAFSMDVFASIQDQMDKEQELREKGKAGEEGSIQANLAKIATRLALDKQKCLHISASSSMEQAKVFREMFADDDDDDKKDGDEKKEVQQPGIYGDPDED